MFWQVKKGQLWQKKWRSQLRGWWGREVGALVLAFSTSPQSLSYWGGVLKGGGMGRERGVVWFSRPPLQIPGPAPQAFSQGQPGPSAVLAIQPELTALHPLPAQLPIPVTRSPSSSFSQTISSQRAGTMAPVQSYIQQGYFFFLSPLFPPLSNF